MSKEFVNLFAGGGLSTVGAMQAGYTPVGAVEYAEDIAAVYAENIGPHVTVGKVEETDPRPYAGIDLLLASPVCTRASVANSKRGETGVDMAAAEGVVNWLCITRPRLFVMENVTQYRAFASCHLITDCLSALGYWWTADNVQFADYGVPQTRRRLIVRASLDMLPNLPPKSPRLGWYGAISDILDTLPESRFADWQLARLPNLLEQCCLMRPTKYGPEERGKGEAFASEPAATVMTKNDAMRAFLMRGDNTQQEFGKGFHTDEEPAMTVRGYTRPSHAPKAFLVDGANTSDVQAAPGVGVSAPSQPSHIGTAGSAQWRAWLCGVQGEGRNLFRDGGTPSPTITTAHSAGKYRALLVADPAMTVPGYTRPSHAPKEFLVSDQTEDSGRGVGVRAAHAPASTVLTRAGGGASPKAFLVDGTNSGKRSGQPTLGASADPAMTVCGGGKNSVRAWLDRGRVVSLTPRALGRLQTLPDWYALPEKRSLASTIIGNGVPCEGIRRILEGLL